MLDTEPKDIVPDSTPLLQSGVTEPPVPHLWDEFQGVQNAAARAALVGTPLETLQKQYKDRFDKAASFIEERAKIHNDAVEAENKRLADLASSLHKRQLELEAELKPLRDTLPAARKAFIESGVEVNSLRRKVRASHLQFQFQREEEVNQHRRKRRSALDANGDDSWLTRLWPFRRRQTPEPIEPYEVKQLDIEDADVPPELVDFVNAAWKEYSTAQVDWSSQQERYDFLTKELASVEAQIADTRERCGWLDRYKIQILDFHKAVKLKLDIEYEQIQAALLDAYDLAKASKAAKSAISHT
jgi:hypothetical protein